MLEIKKIGHISSGDQQAYYLGSSLLIPCSMSDWGLICQCAMRQLLTIN